MDMYQGLGAAVTYDYKLSGLEQYKCSKFGGSKFEYKKSAGLCSL